MAEFCLDCWNKINETEHTQEKYINSKNFELCEECGEWTNVIIMERKYYYLHKFRFVISPFKLLYNVLYILSRILILPYLIYKDNKKKAAKKSN
jgi:hypothetical protein